jgi:copper(I)-binding protein
VIDNPTGQKDTLLDVRSEVSDKVEVHLTAVDENGVASMVKQDSVPVLPRESVAFEPGGLHVMLIGLRKDLAPGDTFQLTLVFKGRGEIVVEVPVQSP